MKSVFEFELVVGVKYESDDNFCYYDVETEFNEVVCRGFFDEFNRSFDENTFENSGFVISSTYRVKLMIKADNKGEAIDEVYKRMENLFKDDGLTVRDIIFMKTNVINDAENKDQMLVKCSEIFSTIFSIKAPSAEIAVEYIKDLVFNQEINLSTVNSEYEFAVLVDKSIFKAKDNYKQFHVVDLKNTEPHSKLFFDDNESEEIDLNTEIKRNDFRDCPKPSARPLIAKSNYLWKFHNVKVNVTLSKIVCIESKDLDSAYNGLKSAVDDNRINFDEDNCEVEVNITPTNEEADRIVYWDKDNNRVKVVR